MGVATTLPACLFVVLLILYSFFRRNAIGHFHGKAGVPRENGKRPPQAGIERRASGPVACPCAAMVCAFAAPSEKALLPFGKGCAILS